MSDYVNGLIEAQAAAIAFAKKSQEEKDKVHKATGQGVEVTEFGVGTLVTVRYPEDISGKSKPPKKLLTQRQGPMVGLSSKGSTYQLKNLADEKLHSVHVSRLKYSDTTSQP